MPWCGGGVGALLHCDAAEVQGEGERRWQRYNLPSVLVASEATAERAKKERASQPASQPAGHVAGWLPVARGAGHWGLFRPC